VFFQPERLNVRFIELEFMVSKSKLYAQLDSLESQLEELLVPHLERAASGGNDRVFCVAEFNAHPELNNRPDKTTKSLIGLGRRILALKEKLGEPCEGSVAARICWYCNSWGNGTNHHGMAAQEMAQEFLEEIRTHDQ
jgi:hypothetical protein